MTIGEVVLPVYAKGINKQTKLNVIDCSSVYKEVLSMFHQTMKFPTPWGIHEFKSEQKIAREFYKVKMKP